MRPSVLALLATVFALVSPNASAFEGDGFGGVDARLRRLVQESLAVEARRVPYRDATSRDGFPEPLTVRLPGTKLGLTGGSAWLRRVAESRSRPRGFYVALQLTY